MQALYHRACLLELWESTRVKNRPLQRCRRRRCLETAVRKICIAARQQSPHSPKDFGLVNRDQLASTEDQPSSGLNRSMPLAFAFVCGPRSF